jgi:hypothetical protein
MRLKFFNCGQFNSNRLEKVQTEAARIVCGFPSYASIEDFSISLSMFGPLTVITKNNT